MASSYDPRLWCCDGVEGVEGMVEVELFLPSGVWVWVGGVLLVHVSKHPYTSYTCTSLVCLSVCLSVSQNDRQTEM